MNKRQIESIKARQILDSRGNPTLEAVVVLNDGSIGRAAVPSGASTGEHELAELRDNDPSLYLGKGVTQAVEQVTQTILPALKGKNISAQQEIDQILTELADDQGRKLGSNAPCPASTQTRCLEYRLPVQKLPPFPIVFRSIAILEEAMPIFFPFR